MRIVKMSTDIFEDEEQVHSFFKKELRSRGGGTVGGKFRIPAGWIAEDGLKVGEPLLFSHQGVVLYSAKASSSRRTNDDEESEEYPFYFDVNVESIRPVKENVTLHELQNGLNV